MLWVILPHISVVCECLFHIFLPRSCPEVSQCCLFLSCKVPPIVLSIIDEVCSWSIYLLWIISKTNKRPLCKFNVLPFCSVLYCFLGTVHWEEQSKAKAILFEVLCIMCGVFFYAATMCDIFCMTKNYKNYVICKWNNKYFEVGHLSISILIVCVEGHTSQRSDGLFNYMMGLRIRGCQCCELDLTLHSPA